MLGDGDMVVTYTGIITSPLAPENVWSRRTDIRQTLIYFLCISYLLHLCVCVCVCVCVAIYLPESYKRKTGRKTEKGSQGRTV